MDLHVLHPQEKQKERAHCFQPMHCHRDWQHRETLEIKAKRLEINRNNEARLKINHESFLMEVRNPFSFCFDVVSHDDDGHFLAQSPLGVI
jgi:hypothetical protein